MTTFLKTNNEQNNWNTTNIPPSILPKNDPFDHHPLGARNGDTSDTASIWLDLTRFEMNEKIALILLMVQKSGDQTTTGMYTEKHWK